MAIKALFFDCFGVLTTDTWQAFIDGLPSEANVSAARRLNHQLDAGLITQDEFITQVHEATGQYPAQVEKMLKSEVSKNTALLEYIRELKKDYAIGMISNIASNWVRDSFLTAEEQALFDEMIFSYEVGITKPDPRIFMLACERLRVSTHEAVMIDDIETYVEAAQAEGMHGIVYRDFTQLKHELEALLRQE